MSAEESTSVYRLFKKEQKAFIGGPVDKEMQANFFDILQTFSGSDAPVDIYLSTTGGDIYIALGIFDLIRSSPLDVNIIANGEVMSSGTLILQAATIRYATPSAQFLIHYGSESSDSAAELKHLREVEKYWIQKFVDRTGKSVRTVRKWHSAEKYFNAKQALQDGLIDGIFTLPGGK